MKRTPLHGGVAREGEGGIGKGNTGREHPKWDTREVNRWGGPATSGAGTLIGRESIKSRNGKV